MSFRDKQEGGNHYKNAKIQPIDFIVENGIKFREANAIKYIFRHESKNGAEDIKKAIHYLEMILETEYTEVEELLSEAEMYPELNNQANETLMPL